MMKPFTALAVVLLALIAFGHLLRVLAGWELVIAQRACPLGVWRAGDHAMARGEANRGPRHS